MPTLCLRKISQLYCISFFTLFLISYNLFDVLRTAGEMYYCKTYGLDRYNNIVPQVVDSSVFQLTITPSALGVYQQTPYNGSVDWLLNITVAALYQLEVSKVGQFRVESFMILLDILYSFFR